MKNAWKLDTLQIVRLAKETIIRVGERAILYRTCYMVRDFLGADIGGVEFSS